MCLWWACTKVEHKFSRLNRAIALGTVILAVYLISGARFIQLIEIGNDLRARDKFQKELEQFMHRNHVNRELLASGISEHRTNSFCFQNLKSISCFQTSEKQL